jgi:hypothetical protein
MKNTEEKWEEKMEEKWDGKREGEVLFYFPSSLPISHQASFPFHFSHFFSFSFLYPFTCDFLGSTSKKSGREIEEKSIGINGRTLYR